MKSNVTTASKRDLPRPHQPLPSDMGCIPSSLLGQFQALPSATIERIEARHKLESGVAFATQLNERRRQERLRENLEKADAAAAAAATKAERRIAALNSRRAKLH